jgi:hypothetical protein
MLFGAHAFIWTGDWTPEGAEKAIRGAVQNKEFLTWAMLGSNQRPLPCEGSVIVCWSFLELAKFLQIEGFNL